MRKDQLYNLGGFDPSHPSGNVLSEFVHSDECAPDVACGCDHVVVRHYDHKGKPTVDRKLTVGEHDYFFPVGEGSLPRAKK